MFAKKKKIYLNYIRFKHFQYFQMCTIWELRSEIKFNFESFWNLMRQVDFSGDNPTRALHKTCRKPLLCFLRFPRLTIST